MSKTIATKVKELPVILTPEEISAKGRELAQTHADLAKLQTDQAAQKAEMKKATKELEKRIYELAHQIRSGNEERPVEVDFIITDEGDVIKEVRRDTGEIINIRAPQEGERQRGMFEG